MAEIISGKLVSSKIRSEISSEVEILAQKYGRRPGLAVVLVGLDPASCVYVRNKHRACVETGIESFQIELPENTTEDELLARIDELNADERVNGILVQLPLPAHISESRVIERILPTKDVDAFHPENVGRIMIGNYDMLPCTPAGVVELLRHYGIDPTGKKCAVIGRSNIVGKPMLHLLTEMNGTVTLCHSRTQDLAKITSDSDILVVAIGKPRFITREMVKPGAVIIDVGINRLADGTLVGDVDFGPVSEIASAITPVPGGVGPMTITMLLRNTLTAAGKQLSGKH